MTSKNEDSGAFNARSTRLWAMAASAYGSEIWSRCISIAIVSFVAYMVDTQLGFGQWQKNSTHIITLEFKGESRYHRYRASGNESSLLLRMAVTNCIEGM